MGCFITAISEEFAPKVNVQICGHVTNGWTVPALLNTGADHVVGKVSMLEMLGIDPTNYHLR